MWISFEFVSLFLAIVDNSLECVNKDQSGADVTIFEMPSLKKAEILRMAISQKGRTAL